MQKKLTDILIPFVYFIAGATTLAGVAATFFYKETLGLSIPQTQIIASISIIPWSIKPLYGFLSDRCPIWKLRRKPYLALAGILSVIGYWSLATWVHDFRGAMLAVLLAGMGFALADVIVDGIVAERSRTQKVAGKLQTICRASLLLGALIVAYLSGILVELIGERNIFWLTGSLPIFTILFAFLIKESPQLTVTFSLRETWNKLKTGFTPELLWSITFLFIWRATPSAGSAYSFFLIDELGFDPEFFGRLSLASHTMGIAGVVIFRKYLISLPIKKLLLGVVIASIILGLPNIGLIYGWYEYVGMSPRLFALADTIVSAPLSEIGFIPLLVLAARLCPKGIEATMFALLASVMNIGLGVSEALGGWIAYMFDVHQAFEGVTANYTHVDKVLWIAILSSLLPLLLLKKLPDIRAASERIPETSPSAETTKVIGADDSKQEIA